MSDLSDYPEEHPETGKVKNPLTGNFITKDYAKREGVLDQAKQHTQQHFMEQDQSGDTSEEIDKLLEEAENAEPGEAFEIEDEELERLDERADINHPEVPDSEFPDEEEFDNEFKQPPTPEGLDQAAQSQQGSGEDYQGIYSARGNTKPPKPQSTEEKSFEQKHEDTEVRYVRTEYGGMKTVYPNEQDEDK